MRDELPEQPEEKECGIVNFNKSSEPGSHWVAYYKDGNERIYFDSFGCVAPIEIRKYLKTTKIFWTVNQSSNEIQILFKSLTLKYAVNSVFMSWILCLKEQSFKISSTP